MVSMKTCEHVFTPTKIQDPNLFVEDLNTCKSLVKFEPSPVEQFLCDLDKVTRKRTFQFVAGIGEQRQLPLCLTLTGDHVYDMIQVSLRKRRRSAIDITNEPSISESISSSEPPSSESIASPEPASTPKPLLALEWQPEPQKEWPADFEALLEDEDEESWFGKPTMSVISDICELTSKLGNRVPKTAMFLWAQFMHLISCSKKFLSCERSEDQGSNPKEVLREPPRGCYLSFYCKDFSEERSRAVADKKTKKQDTKRNLKRTHGALIEKYHNNTNRKRAMDSRRFHRGGGRRGC